MQTQPPVTDVTTSRNGVVSGATTSRRNGAVCNRPVVAAGGQASTSRNASLIEMGGQYAAPIGTSTRDKSDVQRDREAVESFNAAMQEAVTATFGGQAF